MAGYSKPNSPMGGMFGGAGKMFGGAVGALPFGKAMGGALGGIFGGGGKGFNFSPTAGGGGFAFGQPGQQQWNTSFAKPMQTPMQQQTPQQPGLDSAGAAPQQPTLMQTQGPGTGMAPPAQQPQMSTPDPAMQPQIMGQHGYQDPAPAPQPMGDLGNFLRNGGARTQLAPGKSFTGY